MLAASREALSQEGCLSFVFAEILGDAGHFVVLESWADEQAMERHYRSPAFADYQRAIAKLLVRDSEYRLHLVTDTLHPLQSTTIVTDQDD